MLSAENLDNKIKEFWPKNGPSHEEVEKYVKKYSKEKIVIKCGGKVLLDPLLLNSLIEDVVILKKLGLTPILIHGGGLGIKKKLDESNILLFRFDKFTFFEIFSIAFLSFFHETLNSVLPLLRNIEKL